MARVRDYRVKQVEEPGFSDSLQAPFGHEQLSHLLSQQQFKVVKSLKFHGQRPPQTTQSAKNTLLDSLREMIKSKSNV